MRTKCLVTGASGFLGRETMRVCREGYEVRGVSRGGGGADVMAADLRRPEAVRNMLDAFQPDLVVHCAAYREPDFCEDHREETRRLNVDAVRSLCEQLDPAALFVLISSDYVFDGRSPPYHEDDEPSPVNYYGETKVAAERIAQERERWLIVRPPLLAGAGPTLAASGFITQLMQAVESKQSLDLDDVLIRCPTWTRDVARAVRFLADRGANGIFHASGPRGGTRYQWTLEMGRLLGADTSHLQPSAAVVPRRAVRPPDSRLATDKIRGLGFGPFTDFAAVAQEVLKSFGAV
ncbi:MAG: SDR family oxidoreductase [Kiritimatiellae bacterium]|nr:SDR family oxidoreductase [Kiritimatiellia bacterium]